jgi:hypothetical protein
MTEIVKTLGLGAVAGSLIGILIGIVLVAWVGPTTDKGAVLLISICAVIFALLGVLSSAIKKKLSINSEIDCRSLRGVAGTAARAGIELDRSLLNPLQQLEAAAQSFDTIANQAFAGSTEAIEQLDEAGRQFIATATAVGASAGQAAATREVRAVITQVIGQVSAAQTQGASGVERAIWSANQRMVEMLDTGCRDRGHARRIRRLQRSLS